MPSLPFAAVTRAPQMRGGDSETLRLVVPYTTAELTRTALEAAGRLARDMEAEVLLVSVQVVPWPCALDHPTVSIGHLKSRLAASARAVNLHVTARLVLARDPASGYDSVLAPGSLILIATKRRWRRTAEEKLARQLARTGHSVAVIPAGEGSDARPVFHRLDTDFLRRVVGLRAGL